MVESSIPALVNEKNSLASLLPLSALTVGTWGGGLVPRRPTMRYFMWEKKSLRIYAGLARDRSFDAPAIPLILQNWWKLVGVLSLREIECWSRF